jgi:hypothetical protein
LGSIPPPLLVSLFTTWRPLSVAACNEHIVHPPLLHVGELVQPALDYFAVIADLELEHLSLAVWATAIATKIGLLASESTLIFTTTTTVSIEVTG